MAVLFSLALLCIYPINNLRWEIQLQDSLKGKQFLQDYQAIEESFGGLGSLIIVLQSKDSLAAFNLAQDFSTHFQKDTLVHFIDYTADVDFFQKNKLLYADEDDLATVISHVESVEKKAILKKNPFYIELDTEASSEAKDSVSSPKDVLNIVKDIEDKYFSSLQQSYSNADGTIRVIEIYPTHSLTDLQANRQLFGRAKAYLEEKTSRHDIKVLYSGKVFDSIQTGKMLLPEAKVAGGIAAGVILLLLILHFYKQPQLILISALPMALPTVFTLALAYLLFGRICLFTLPLALLLPGHACQIITHVHTRYFHERQMNLSPVLSVESAILGIGPTVATSALVMAVLFASLVLIPLPGLQEFGILGAIGSLLNLWICPLLSTSLLLFLQRKKPFKILGSAYRTHKIKLLPNFVNWAIIITLSSVSFVGILYSGTNLKFMYDFNQIDLQHEQDEAHQLMSETGFVPYDPIIVMLPDSSYNTEILKDFQHLKARNKAPDISRIYTQYQFLPKLSERKQEQVKRLRRIVTPEVLTDLGAADSAAVMDMLNSYDGNVKDFELSENIRRKFSDKNGNPGVFAFLISKSDPSNGLTCRHITSQLKMLEGVQDNKFRICGTPVLRASVLDAILVHLNKSILLGIILLWVILLMYYNNLSRAFFTMLPSIFSISWLTIIIHFSNTDLSAYSSLAFILLIGASVDGSLQLWAAYYEKQRGTAITVLQTKLSSIIFAQLASMIGTFALLFSSHPGIRSMGQVSLIGTICIFVSQFTIYPLIAGTLDQYRVFKKLRQRHGKTTLH